MKRFYCTVENKVKRVRQLPDSLLNVDLAKTPVHKRQARGRWYSERDVATRAVVNHRGKVRKPYTGKPKGLSASQARSKSKKG